MGGDDRLTAEGPKIVIFADKAGVRKILLEADLKKAPIYDYMRQHPKNASLFTETDKIAHRDSVLRSYSGNCGH